MDATTPLSTSDTSPAPVVRNVGDPALFAAIRRHDARWVAVARAWGFDVLREPGAYVSYLGDGIIRVAPYADLDPDDCLAQVVFHELCHFCVEGPASRDAWDWGLDNTSADDVGAELSAIRMQAHLLAPFGLREVLAPTTDFRVDYDALPADPFADAGTDGAIIERARAGVLRARAHAAWPLVVAELEAVSALAQVG